MDNTGYETNWSYRFDEVGIEELNAELKWSGDEVERNIKDLEEIGYWE